MGEGRLPEGTVTLLFTDIEGSTRLLRELGDQYDAVLADHHALLRDAITTNGGITVNTEGDAFFAVFESAAAGAAAALDAQRRLRDATWPSGVTVRVRMGLHTGDVRRGGDDYVGMAVHQAARIASAGHGGQVLLSATTAAMVADGLGHGVSTVELGRFTVKDFDAPQPIFQLRDAALVNDFPPLRVPAASATTAPPGSAFVGRQRELDQLTDVLDEVLRTGVARLVLVAGEPGIGKTRLVEELGTRAAATDARVVWGRAWEEGGAPPLWPWVEVLRVLGGPDVIDARDGPGTAPRVGSSEDQGRRFQLFDAVVAFLRDRAASEPLVIVLDDMHAADEATLLLLQFTARELRDAPVLLLATHRQAEVRDSPDLARRFGALAREGVSVTLEGLSESAVAELIAARTNQGVSQATVQSVFDATAGNPFFVDEVSRLLASGGKGIPDGVREAVRRRLEALSPDAIAALTAAAVVGREFDASIIESIGISAIDAIGAAERHALITSVAPGRWRFSHVLVRDVLYADASPSARARLHRQVGEQLELRGAPAAELALHFYEASAGGDQTKGMRACQAAGDAALLALAYEEAAQQYRRALALAAPGDDRYDLLMGLGDALRRAGRYPEGKPAFLEAVAVARAAGTAERQARAALAAAGHADNRVDHERVAMLSDALAALPPGDSALRANVMAELAQNRRNSGYTDEPRPETLARDALAMARRVGDDAVLAVTLYGLHYMLLGDHRTLAERHSLSREFLTTAERTGDTEWVIIARLWLADDLFQLGDVAGAENELLIGNALAVSIRQPAGQWSTSFPRATLALMRGQPNEAKRLADVARAVGESTGFADVVGCWSIQRIDRLLALGRYGDAVAFADGIEAGPALMPFLAMALAADGNTERARSLTQMATSFVLASDGVTLWALAFLAEAAVLLDDHAIAAQLYDALLPYGDEHIVVPIMCSSRGSCSRYLAMLSDCLGRPDEAAAFRARAEVHHRRLGALRFLDADATPVALPPVSRFLNAGDVWMIEFAGTKAAARDTTGMSYLAALLRDPGREVHVLELTGAAPIAADAGPVLDDEAKAAYRSRLAALRAQVDEASAANDLARAERAEAEIDVLVGQLKSATGLGGRDRALDSAAEKARQSVTRAIRRAIERIEAALPELGAHLAVTIRTGTFCAYEPGATSPVPPWEVALSQL